ncbi:MAG TPA: MBL fold metallo-hydrolase [Cellvibrio sp.]|nr:MBL fold metallo-hydrolase [Cellvibrio sp.]
MNKLKFSLRILTATLASIAISTQAATLESAAAALKAAETNSIVFSGTGQWYQFGQAPAPTLAWPQFDVSSYNAEINYTQPAAHVQIVRKQTIEAGRNRPAPVEQKPDQYFSEGYAWNLAAPANSPAGTAPVASAQPAAAEERSAEIWSTPQGFLKAAVANKASSKSVKDAVEVSFTVQGKYRYVGTINARNQVESIKTWIDSPVLGDTLYETQFSDYKDYSGIQFPQRIVRNLGGHPVLKLDVASVKANAPVDIKAPQEIASAKPAAVNVTVGKLAEGVFYLTGGTHHSVAIEQRDHIVLVESPQNEERSLALIAKIKETFLNKPVKYLVNTHAHFDHSGGLRTFVDADATVVTHKDNQSYYQKAWSQAHSINPDRLAASKKTARFETFKDKHVLTDGSRKIEIHSIAGNSHNDAFALVYLPAEKILIEADAYSPLAPGATPPASVNPFSVNLYENIQKLKLEVDQIAALHGPGVVKLADLQAFINPIK